MLYIEASLLAYVANKSPVMFVFSFLEPFNNLWAFLKYTPHAALCMINQTKNICQISVSYLEEQHLRDVLFDTHLPKCWIVSIKSGHNSVTPFQDIFDDINRFSYLLPVPLKLAQTVSTSFKEVLHK